MKRNLIIPMFLCILHLQAQVAKKTVVEHFTNSRCSICAARNPGFFNNLNAQSNVIHLAIYPSSPYANCLLSQHNKIEADARTNYYGVYGGTPRLAINGSVISGSSDYSAQSLFDPYLAQSSPIRITISQAKYANDSIRSTIVLKTESTHTLSTQRLFVTLAEDTVFYSSPNGETKHYNVFRKAMTDANGLSVTVPTQVGDSIVYNVRSTVHNAWNVSRMFTIAILQDEATKVLTQSESVSAKANTVMNIQTLQGANQFLVFAPRDGSRNIYIKGADATGKLMLELCDMNGRTILTKNIQSENEMINASGLSRGAYIYSVRKEHMVIKSGKLILE